jgi:transposase
MYFRKKKGKTGQCLQLIESYRDSSNNPRQRVILSLGDADLPENLWKPIANELENRLKDTPSLFKTSEEIEKWVDRIIRTLENKNWTSQKALKKEPPKIIEVDPALITHRNTTELGPELVALHAWNLLEIPELLKSLGFSGSQVNTCTLSVINRLIDPCSEHALPDWVRTTSCSELMKSDFGHITEDRFYRITDKLITHKEAIERHLEEKERSLFELRRTIYLYDLSNTYFEGECRDNPKGKRGNSKEKRTDAPLISFGMVLDMHGFVIRHQTFAGNTGDAKTLLEMVRVLESEDDFQEKPTIVFDSGMASEENLRSLRDAGYDYIAVGKRPTRLAYAKEFETLEFAIISGRENKDPVHIAFRDIENERLVFCYSEKRAEKEKAILSQAEKKYIEDMTKLCQQLSRGRLKREGALERQLGRLQERHQRIARYYEVTVSKEVGNKTLTFIRKEDKFAPVQELAGCYHLRTSRQDLSADEIWKTYMMLTRVEASFKALKSDLGLRPIFHHREDRCDSHIFITVLAYHLLNLIEYKLRNCGDTRSWISIRRLLKTHSYTTIVVPSSNGRVYNIRAPSVPDFEQQKIYTMLGISWKSLPRSQVII